jgi:hypothetical protein
MHSFSDLSRLHPVAVYKIPVWRYLVQIVLSKLTFTKRTDDFKIFLQRQNTLNGILSMQEYK